jgi:hypothetical protein
MVDEKLKVKFRYTAGINRMDYLKNNIERALKFNELIQYLTT